jgi:DNA-binding NarL/FixJ family response regulator
LIEESINRLTEVLRKADKSIVMLSKETGKQKKSEEVYSNLKPKAIPVPETKQEENKKKTIQEKVIELHNKGLSSNVISNRLDISVGEIDLIISIHGRKS